MTDDYSNWEVVVVDPARKLTLRDIRELNLKNHPIRMTTEEFQSLLGKTTRIHLYAKNIGVCKAMYEELRQKLSHCEYVKMFILSHTDIRMREEQGIQIPD